MPIVVQVGDSGGPCVFQAAFTAGRIGAAAGRPEGGRPDLVIDGDQYVSPLHARFSPLGETWFVEDLGSANGTWVNGMRAWGPWSLAKGDKVRIGRTVLTVVPA